MRYVGTVSLRGKASNHTWCGGIHDFIHNGLHRVAVVVDGGVVVVHDIVCH